VVKFTAAWCGPCKAIAPFFNNLAVENSSTVKFLEIDIDTAAEITDYEDVKSIPLFLFYYNGAKLENLSMKGSNQQILSDNFKKFVRLTDVPVAKIEGIVIPPVQSEKIVDMSKLTLDEQVSSEDSSESEDFPAYDGDEKGEECGDLLEESIPK
jgi:thioredoxin 1